MIDFTPTKQQISLHGLGFIQIILPNDRRMHVWHPDLPRRACYKHSSIHNHRFSFVSTVLVGTQVNRRFSWGADGEGAYDLISHDGPRTPTGSRESFVCTRGDMEQNGEIEYYEPGESYIMQTLEYHDTPCDGKVVTIMQKLHTGKIHASSSITHGMTFDQSFDRFQLSDAELWEFVVDTLKG